MYLKKPEFRLDERDNIIIIMDSEAKRSSPGATDRIGEVGTTQECRSHNEKVEQIMQRSQIEVGGIYTAKVAGNLTQVRLDTIRTVLRGRMTAGGYRYEATEVFDVTNLKTGRKTTFRSAAKFRAPAKSGNTLSSVRFAGGQEEDPMRPEGEQSPDPTPVLSAVATVAGTPALVSNSNSTGFGAKLAALVTTQAEGKVAGYIPTREQSDILEAVRQPGLEALVIAAGAGTGKTSTLKMLESILPGRGQYTAFNASLVAESKTKFVRARCNTTHSLAFAAVGRQYAHRLGGNRVRSDEVARMLGIESITVSIETPRPARCGDCGENVSGVFNPNSDQYDGCPECKSFDVIESSVEVSTKTLKPGFLANRVMGAVRKFCQSADQEIGTNHFARQIPGIDLPGEYTNQDAVLDALVPFAQKAWADLSATDGKLPFSHDCYVKIWSLGQGENAPVIQADYILLDEAQDTAPVFLDVLKRQSVLIILVGDDNQQIYCQPEGTMVRVSVMDTSHCGRGLGGPTWTHMDVPIESLRVGDRVVSYSDRWRLGSIRQKGCAVSEITSRAYSGDLISVSVGRLVTKYTPDHHCVVMLGKPANNKWVVYIQRRGNCYRAGVCCGNYQSQGGRFGPYQRAKQEGADALWIVSVLDDKREALSLEKRLHKMIPSRCFSSSGGEGWWDGQESNEENAAWLLSLWGLDISEPFMHVAENYIDYSRTVFTTAARNLVDGMLMLPAGNAERSEKHRSVLVKKHHWQPICTTKEYVNCRVISLSVDDDHTYVADGIVTHNSWRGATNAMKAFPGAPRRLLSQSFRFGQAVADVANSILSGLDEPTDLVMKGCDIPSRVVLPAAGDDENQYPATESVKCRAVLCRTNACAVSTVLMAKKDGKRPHLIGGGAETVAFVRAAQYLQQGQETSHPELCIFKNWSEVQMYVKEDEGGDLKLMVKLIDEFKCQPILNALENMPSEEDADLVVSTAHKCKGREWTTVKLACDFLPANRMGDADRRLLYVAATRAQHILDISECPPFLSSKERETGKEIEPIRIEFTKPMPTASDLHRWVMEKTGGIPVVSVPESARPSEVVGQFTWTSYNGQWCIRGPAGVEPGTIVTVTKKNGQTSRETVVAAVKSFPDATVYRSR